MEKSPHDAERDRIAEEWQKLADFTCAGCKEQNAFPWASRIDTEIRYKGLLRADVAALDDVDGIVGVVEVVRSHPPTSQALAAQESLGFAYYRLLPPPGRDEPIAWLCSPECWRWYIELADSPTSSPWDAIRCDGCSKYIYQNSLSWFEFRDWANDPHYAYCIHCAAAYDASGECQWRSPGELAGGDPREWTPDDNADPASLLLAYSEAGFWAMVWTSRVTKLDNTEPYDGNRNPAAENATARRLPMVNAAFDEGEWGRGADLLLPIGSPGWAAYPGETERLLAFRPDNCRGTAAAWTRLLYYRLEQLPQELGDIVRQQLDLHRA